MALRGGEYSQNGLTSVGKFPEMAPQGGGMFLLRSNTRKGTIFPMWPHGDGKYSRYGHRRMINIQNMFLSCFFERQWTTAHLNLILTDDLSKTDRVPKLAVTLIFQLYPSIQLASFT